MSQKQTGVRGAPSLCQKREKVRRRTDCREAAKVAGVQGGLCRCGGGRLVRRRSWALAGALAGTTSSSTGFPTARNAQPTVRQIKVTANRPCSSLIDATCLLKTNKGNQGLSLPTVLHSFPTLTALWYYSLRGSIEASVTYIMCVSRRPYISRCEQWSIGACGICMCDSVFLH